MRATACGGCGATADALLMAMEWSSWKEWLSSAQIASDDDHYLCDLAIFPFNNTIFHSY